MSIKGISQQMEEAIQKWTATESPSLAWLQGNLWSVNCNNVPAFTQKC